MEEIWKDIPDHTGYQVSSLGNVKSCRYGLRFGKWRLITPNCANNKYLQIDLVNEEGIRKGYNLHRIMYVTFIGLIPLGMIVDHKDRNSFNNTLDNFRLATRSQNNINRSSITDKRGIRLDKYNKWEARTSTKGKNIYLGKFTTAKEAAAAYNRYATKVYGEFAVLNTLEGM